jgi:hypothetical protein
LEANDVDNVEPGLTACVMMVCKADSGVVLLLAAPLAGAILVMTNTF